MKKKHQSHTRQLNPEFAISHGLVSTSTADVICCPPEILDQTLKAFHKAISSARNTGKLQISNLGLRSPLPNECFDFRSSGTVDISLNNDNNRKPWEWFMAENLISVDLSDNDLGSCDTVDENCRPQETVTGYLDKRIENYRSLKCLRAKRCHISSLPLDSIYSLHLLSVLDLSGNLISHAIPLELLPPTLTEIDLSYNQIPKLYCGDGDSERVEKNTNFLPLCKTLNVSNNLLTSLFPNTKKFQGLSNLQTLTCGDNKLSGSLFSEEVAVNLRSLTTLEASKNMISVAPDLRFFDKLKVVYLSGNHLKAAPTINLALTRLVLSNNHILSLEGLFDKKIDANAQISSSELVELNLRSNKLTLLDQSMIKLCTKLVFLDVGCNDLTDLPYVLGYLPDLRKVILDGNPLRAIRLSLAEDTVALKKSLRCKGKRPEGSAYHEESEFVSCSSSNSIVDGGNNQLCRSVVLSAFTNLHTLDLCKKNLEGIPEEVRSELKVARNVMNDHISSSTVGSTLKTLKLRDNRLYDFEHNMFDDMVNLCNVDAANNVIESLTGRFDHIPLNSLSLEKNRLTTDAVAKSSLCTNELPTPLSRNLVHLNLSCNRLRYVPGGLFNLRRLSTLILSHNRIVELDGWRPGLESLEDLDLSNNCIKDMKELPAILCFCSPMLKMLLVSNNDLSVIPSEIGMLSNLKSINLRGNPQKSVRPAVLDGSCESIIAFLSYRMTEEDICRFRSKRDSLIRTMTPDSNDLFNDENGPDTGSITTNTTQQQRNEKVCSLRKAIDTLSIELNNVHLSEAKKYALKKSLALQKAKLIQEERRLKQLSN